MSPSSLRPTQTSPSAQQRVPTGNPFAETTQPEAQDLSAAPPPSSPTAASPAGALQLKVPAHPGRTLSKPLQGKKALVTGGSRGIGAAIVQRLARDGAHVAFTYLNSPQNAAKIVSDAQAEGGVVHALRADAGKPEEVQGAVDSAAKTLGGLDILVNNAGIVRAGPLEDMSLAQMNEILAVNVHGPIWGTRASLKYLKHLPDGGRIINVGSVHANRVNIPGVSLYATTKGAVASFTTAMARELGTFGIRINNVQPGPIDTDMNPSTSGALADCYAGLTTFGRYGEAHDVAGVVSMLAGPDGAYMTGAHLNVDGGFTV